VAEPAAGPHLPGVSEIWGSALPGSDLLRHGAGDAGPGDAPRGVPRPRWRAGGDAALLRLRYCAFSEASTSMTSWIFSPTTTPPVGSAMLAVMPQSVRLISPMADRPARVPP
jgi:hypothetical protein